jgi:hypothetical protein
VNCARSSARGETMRIKINTLRMATFSSFAGGAFIRNEVVVKSARWVKADDRELTYDQPNNLLRSFCHYFQAVVYLFRPKNVPGHVVSLRLRFSISISFQLRRPSILGPTVWNEQSQGCVERRDQEVSGPVQGSSTPAGFMGSGPIGAYAVLNSTGVSLGVSISGDFWAVTRV